MLVYSLIYFWGDVMTELYTGITTLYDDYFSKKRIVDKEFVEKTIDLVLGADGTSDLVTNIKFTNLCNSAASYSYYSKAIIFDNSILTPQNQINDEIDIAAHIANILHIIFHECTHVEQFNKVLKGENSIENRMLKYTIIGNEILKLKIRTLIDKGADLNMIISEGITMEALNNLMCLESVVLCDKCYNLSPAERMAEYRAFLIMKDIIKKSKYGKLIDSSINLNEPIKLIKSKGYLKRKDKIFSPTERYFMFLVKSGLEGIDTYIDEILKSKLDLEDRLYYGLPINKEEYKMVKTLKRK